MNFETKVAVCIPTYNQSAYLVESVTSACRQTYPNVEVWVSDDASTDETPSVLEALASEFPQLRHYRQPVNLNIAANNTWLLGQPDAEFIVRLDSDDVLEPQYVETLLKQISADARIGYAHAAVQIIDEDGKFLTVARLARPSSIRTAEAALREAVGAYRVAANICMFRASALRELDYYRGRPDFVEDYDLSVRIAAAGYGNVYEDAVLSRYRVWTDPKRLRSKRKGLQLRGYIRIFDEAFEPAFRERGWDTTILMRRRRWLAAHHAAACFEPQYSETERAELVRLLTVLAGGMTFGLRLRLLVGRRGFGFIFEKQSSAVHWAKTLIKNALSRWRRS